MIKIQNLNKYYGDVQILKNVDMEISKGEIFGIIGHSGAGKSTLLRCINGLEDYRDGSLTIEGQEVKDLTEKEIRELRKNLGMIFQHFSLLERKTVFENVALPLECFKYSKAEIEKRVMNLLELVGLADKRDAKPRNLSGGQKQRVAIARALALEPKVLLCDEATSALDPNTTKSILALLQDINEKMNITIIVVTHQMEVVKQICTKVAVMEGGRVLEIENTEDLFLNNTAGLKALMGDEQIVLPEGTNIKIIFPKEIANQNIITNMARTLDFDFNISYGKLEKFREDVLGSLIITVKDHYANAVKRYLDEKNIKWEEIKNDK